MFQHEKYFFKKLQPHFQTIFKKLEISLYFKKKKKKLLKHVRGCQRSPEI